MSYYLSETTLSFGVGFKNKRYNSYNKLKMTNTIMPTIHISCNIDKSILNDFTDIMFKECDLQSFGYNTQNDEYWGKKWSVRHNVHFTLSIVKTGFKQSTMIIKYLNGSNNEINKIYKNIKKIIDAYDSIKYLFSEGNVNTETKTVTSITVVI